MTCPEKTLLGVALTVGAPVLIPLAGAVGAVMVGPILAVLAWKQVIIGVLSTMSSGRSR